MIHEFPFSEPVVVVKQSHRTKRPHTKSRYGCLSCKARRVKCQETRPHPCANCVTRNTSCVYPPLDQLLRRRHNAPDKPQGTEKTSHPSSVNTSAPALGFSSPMRLRTLSDRFPNTFSSDDLRFFHHFLVAAHPHLPFGNEDLWKTSLPAYAYECPHLMHAILSLGASHLSLLLLDGSRYAHLAVVHRGKALRLLGDALVAGDQCSQTELDLVLATAYALTFQANYMTDGLVDFLVMARGCAIITCQILNKHQRSEVFELLSLDDVCGGICSRLPSTPCCDGEMLDICIASLERIEPLLENSTQRRIYHAFLNTYKGLQNSARAGFVALIDVYTNWERMAHQEFMEFLDPHNYIARLLLLHFVTITTIMRPVFCLLRPRMLDSPKDVLANNQWGLDIYESLPSEMRGLVEWQTRYIALDKSLIQEMDV